jgi:hypothetical protein
LCKKGVYHENLKKLSLADKAQLYAQLLEHPAWHLLQASFTFGLNQSIKDTNSKEQFLYEAIRLQALKEVFQTPNWVLRQYERQEGRQFDLIHEPYFMLQIQEEDGGDKT